MGYGTESDGRSADSQLYGHLVDPRYAVYRDGELSEVWADSERLRALLKNRKTAGNDREFLARELERQLPTLGLYRQAVRFKGEKGLNLILFVIVFPGEGKDNTGIKDLNDKILGYRLTNAFIKCRQVSIDALFASTDFDLPPRFAVVGSDYKTAQILGIGRTRKEFADRLKKLDQMLVDCLRNLLPQAKKDAKKEGDQERLKAIAELEDKLKKKGYRFDFLFGARVVDFVIKDPIEASFLVLTETLKGAGVARFMAKSDGARTKLGRSMSSGLKPDPKDQDQRGKGFDHGSFIHVISTAGRINDRIRKTIELFNIWIDKVWTFCLFEFRRNVFIMNPDVIRDVRKKVIGFPTSKEGLKSKGWVTAQIDVLEIWLVAVNALDLVKDFLVPEFDKEVPAYHSKALAAHQEVNSPTGTITWDRLEQVLGRDLRQKTAPLPVQGRASEYAFYAESSDNMSQIFFAMDIRDLGVQIALLYDWFIGEIEVQKPRGAALMKKTFHSSDHINRRKRYTYDTVVGTFRKYFEQTKTPDALRAAITAMGGAGADLDRPGKFEDSVQVMMGGDEVFVAAHPIYAQFVCNIVSELRAATFKDQPLDLRTGVVFSRAKKSKDQKQANWEAHEQALGLALSSLNPLKKLERAHRRIERLIEKLEKDKKKKTLIPKYTAKLEALGLMSLFARSNHRLPQVLSWRDFRELVRKLTEAYDWSEPYTELVDGKCQVVDAKKLQKAVDDLETEIARIVGFDNWYMDPLPLVTDMGPVIRKIIDFFLPPEKYPYEESEWEKKEREIERDRKRRERGPTTI